jgi:hypothetical protein
LLVKVSVSITVICFSLYSSFFNLLAPEFCI